MDCLQEAIMLHLLRLILVLSLIMSSALAADQLTESVNRVIEKFEIEAEKMKIPVNTVSEKGMKAAQEAANSYESPVFQEKLRCEQKRLREEVFADSTQDIKADLPVAGKLAQDEKLYLFLSSSIPDDTVHNYLEAVERLNEPNFTLMMKGYVPGERTQYLIRITRKDRNCVDQLHRQKPVLCDRFEIPIKIKPALFEKFEISQVPALVYDNNRATWKITGDARLDYLLERINQEAKSPGLKGMVTVLQRGEYE